MKLQLRYTRAKGGRCCAGRKGGRDSGVERRRRPQQRGQGGPGGRDTQSRLPWKRQRTDGTAMKPDGRLLCRPITLRPLLFFARSYSAAQNRPYPRLGSCRLSPRRLFICSYILFPQWKMDYFSKTNQKLEFTKCKNSYELLKFFF